MRRRLGFADFIGGVAGRNGNIELYSEIAVFAPAEVEVKTAPLAGNERKQNQFAPGHLKVPAAVRTGISLGICRSARIPGRQPRWRNYQSCGTDCDSAISAPDVCHPACTMRAEPDCHCFKPPDRVELVVGVYFGQPGSRCDSDAVPPNANSQRQSVQWAGRRCLLAIYRSCSRRG